jgi:hypothetical protein
MMNRCSSRLTTRTARALRRAAGALAAQAWLMIVVAGTAGAAPRIVNGVESQDFPTTGALLFSGGATITDQNQGLWCSGTLIGCSTFLVAAHCVENSSNPAAYRVYLQHGGIYSVASVSDHPGYNPATFPIADVAVLKLSAPVEGITPTPFNDIAAVAAGTPGNIAGFGRTGGSSVDYAIKRAGAVTTAPCSGQPLPSGAGDTELVCWNFQAPIGAPGEDSNTCNGDSGGPLFVDLGGQTVVAGVTSGGTSATCLTGDLAYDANVFTYRSYIQAQLGADSQSVCGGLPPVGDPSVDVQTGSGALDATTTQRVHTFSVPANSTLLVVAMNGEDNGTFDTDLYVKQGLGVSTVDYDCKVDDASNFSVCRFPSPTGGDYSVLARRWSGAGRYQVTTTVFGGDAPACGNDVKEFGEGCDGTDAELCQGLCQLDCQCPPPMCGNDVVEAGEECDGLDVGTCPTGTCEAGCVCPAPVCGNDVAEAGEDCDGVDDDVCPGDCGGDCSCPPSCFTQELRVLAVKADARKLQFKAEIDTFFNEAYDGLDPRSGFALRLYDGTTDIVLEVPPADPGWERSKPSRGKWQWKGSIDGLVKVSAREKLSKFRWQIKVKGSEVAQAENLNLDQTIAVRVTIADVCTEDAY